MVQNIIIQAGGRGSRLESLTLNKPKCLVSIDNMPIIFHMFKAFPTAKFKIIADYHVDVLIKYLEVFAKDYNFEIVHARKKGTCSGIREALSRIPQDEQVMITWCDLILNKDFKWPHNTNNYIGISTDFICRWSFKKGQCVREPSKDDGIAGVFFFRNASALNDIPEEGAFVRWLSTTNIELERLSLSGSKEVGTMLCYNENVSGTRKCRPFNKMTVNDDIIIKEPITPQGVSIASDERNWYEVVETHGYKHIPKIYNLNPLQMELIDGKNIFEYNNFNLNQKKSLLKKIVNVLKELHDLVPAQQANVDDCLLTYFEKTFSRIESIKSMLPFGEDEFIQINGKKYKNIFFMKGDILSKIQKILPEKFNFIHGDPTFSNIMLRTSNVDPVLIDPRGYFGNSKIYGDVDYDYAKLYYSIMGNYDQFNNKKFNLEIKDNEVVLDINSSQWEDTQDYFFEITGSDVEKIKLLHALIWISLSTYVWDDYDSICGAFYNGLVQLDEVCLPERFIMSPLNKTWLLDVDGTILKHNGYKDGGDVVLPYVKEFFQRIDKNDRVVLLTARTGPYIKSLESFLTEQGLRFDTIIGDLPHGERILVNDKKMSGLKTAYAINKERDSALEIDFEIDESL